MADLGAVLVPRGQLWAAGLLPLLCPWAEAAIVFLCSHPITGSPERETERKQAGS